MTARLCVLAALVACDLGHHDVLDSGPANTEASTSCAGACHGQGGTAAPPRDTSGRSDTASIGVGAHREHLAGSTWHKNFECATCHKVPDQVGDVGHILNADGTRDQLPAEVVFSGMGAGATWDHDGETCTNSYCHGDTLHQVDPNTGAIVSGAGGSITQPVWTKVDGTQSQCGTCHGNPPPMPHPQNSDCGLCHQTMNPGQPTVIAYPQLHIDGIVQVASTQPCDSCHGSNGQSAPPRDAHGNTATTAPGVGAHAKHMTAGSSWHADVACNECHLVPGSTTDLTHVDQIDEVFMDPTVPLPGGQATGGHLGIKGAAWDPNALTCKNTYCHGGGGSPLTGGATTTPKWTQVDGTQSKCQSCHGMPPPNPHPQDSDCGKCHPTMTPGDNTKITYPAKHIDGNVDVINDQPCNYCHGDPNANPIAGDNFVNAPPNDTMGQTSTDLRSVGAHQSHMRPSSWRAPVTCDQCHTVPTSVMSIGHIDHPLPAYVIFGNLAGSTATWNGSTCSNVYCHGATLNDGGNSAGGTATKPMWTTVDGSQSQCGSCHGLPPPPPHPVDADCGKCHNTMTPGGGLVITDPTRHIDGNLDVNTDQPCNSCHGSPGTPSSNGAAINAPPKDSAGNTATTARGVGAHQSHLSPANLFFKAVLCQDCHTVPATVNSVGHIDHPLPAYVKFSSRAGSTPAWNGAICSNVYCHGATLTDGSTGAGGGATSPVWNKVDGSQAQCTSCHGNPPPLPHPQQSNCDSCHPDAMAGQPTKFSDPTKHIDGNLDVNTNQACNSCHGNHTGTPATNSDPANAPPFDSTGSGSATTLRGVGAHASHLTTGSTWHADVTCGECHMVPATVNSQGHMDHPLPATMAFAGIAAGTAWNGANCSSYCHGSTLLAGGNATNPNWTKVDGTQSTCTSCHGNPPPLPHVQDPNCQNCHNDMSSPTTFSAPQKHINGTVDVTMVHPAGYNAREQHGYDFDKMGQATCATASCHGTALTGGNTGGPSCNNCHSGWQTNCTFCHGGKDNMTGAPPEGVLGTLASPQSVGAHTIHVAQTTRHAAWDCTYCHTKPTGALNPGHIDGTGGVVRAEVVFAGLNPGGSYNLTAFTCSAMYCHGTGRAGATGTAPAWTSTTTLACVDGCHGGDPTRTNMSSQHRNSDHKKSCATCHKNVVDANNNIINLTLHVNGTRDVQFSNAGSSYNPATKSCTNTGNGCHGTGTKSSWN